jgi:uncharacterized 2Fe-2S/4Fe-4S cluster protein (DUF4445 family)
MPLSLSGNIAIAIDLGTTTIAASLLDRASGERLAFAGSLNPQRSFGADVISRMEAACKSPEAQAEMTRLVNSELEALAAGLLDKGRAEPENLAAIAIAANPAMEHLLLGLPVTSLAFPPYRPLFTAGKRMDTAALGWKLSVDAYVFPLPGGFVGGDLVAFFFGVEAADPRSLISGPRLFLDLGTNGEIALVAGGNVFATSAAAGPAFEGGNLACGMAALPGAISGMRFDGDRVSLTVIGGGVPEGVCGSGVIETISGLLQAGVLDPSGRLLSSGEIASNLAIRMISRHGDNAFLLYRDARREIVLTQQDIRQVQLAKGAIRAGIEVLCERAHIHHDEVREAVLTGSFGARLTPEGLKNIGVFPGKMVDVSLFVREGALAGVEKALCTPGGFDEIEKVAAAMRVIPLSGTPSFEKHFLEQINFPKSRLKAEC